MFRYTIIDVGDDLVVFNKDDGAVVNTSRRDSWPPSFPTEDEIKYERQRLRSERIVRTQRLEEDLRSKRIASTYIVKCDEEEEELEELKDCEDEDKSQNSEDSGIATYREDHPSEHSTPVQEGGVTRPDIDQTPITPSPPISKRSHDSIPEDEPTVTLPTDPEDSVKIDYSNNPIHTTGVPYIVAPTRKRAPKSEKKPAKCCAIL